MKTKKAKTLLCPMCHGAGGFREVILDDGSGPREVCGGCDGKGELPRKKFYRLLGTMSHWEKS